MANRDSAALAAARKLRTVEEARAEIETVLRDMQGLKRQLSRLRKQHQDMKQEAGASMQALTGVMDRNALLAARVAALQQAVALQVPWMLASFCVPFAVLYVSLGHMAGQRSYSGL